MNFVVMGHISHSLPDPNENKSQFTFYLSSTLLLEQ